MPKKKPDSTMRLEIWIIGVMIFLAAGIFALIATSPDDVSVPKSTQTVEVQQDNYSTMLGTFNKSRWRYNNTQRGKKTRQTTAILKETLNTDWITEQDANLLEKLIMSTDVYIVENADTTYTQAVMITDSSHVRKTVANDRKIQYTINIEYANPLNTNS